MITCPKCSKENQDHYKFCLGCGAELPRDAAPRGFAVHTPPHGMKAVPGAQPVQASQAVQASPVQASQPVQASPPAPYYPPQVQSPAFAPQPAQPAAQPAPAYATAAAATIAASPQGFAAATAAAPAPVAAGSAAAGPGAGAKCPQCGHANMPSNKFCASCGYNMSLLSGAPPGMSSMPAPMGAPPAPATAAIGQVTLTALRADGSEAGSYPLPSAVATVGRDMGGIFAGDSYLSPRHATLSVRGNKLFVKDELSLNGVYVKLAPEEPIELQSGDVFRIGQEIIRFEVLTPQPPNADGVERLGSPSKGYAGRISLLTGRDTTGNAYPVPEHGIHIGRERGDILFPEDGYVSGLHCRISWENGRGYLTDLGSSNGTFARLYAEREVFNGDVLLMGQQLFRINY